MTKIELVIMKVLILHNTPKAGREDDLDTLLQVAQISTALEKSGYQISIGAVSSLIDIEKLVKQHQPEAVFNLVESFNGSDQYIHLIPAYLESVGVPYTGCSAEAIMLTSNKILSKKIMGGSDIATPLYFDINSEVSDKAIGKFIVKSATEHASFGIDSASVVGSVTTARNLIVAKTVQFGGIWFSESYIDGREFNVSVMGSKENPQILPLAEIVFNNFASNVPKIVDYSAKWNEKSDSYNNTPRVFIDEAENLILTQKIKEIVLKCWYAFELCGYARVDLRIDNEGNPWVLEINANPCLTADAGFIAAAEKAGMTYIQTINYIMEFATNDTNSSKTYFA
jgi:D-alanine-D-alanine ligase